MLGASDAKSAYKILNDLDYSTHIGDIANVSNFQEVVNAGLIDVKDLLVKICPDPRIVDILFLAYDVHNIKTLLKGIKAGKGQEEVRAQLLTLGRVSITQMEAFFYEKETTSLDLPDAYVETIRKGVAKAEALYEAHGNDPRILDFVIDRMHMELLAKVAKSVHHPYITEFVRQTIDLTNLQAYLRIKLLKQEDYFTTKDRIKLVFAKGGSFDIDFIAGKIDIDLETAMYILKASEYGDVAIKGIEAFQKHKSFAYLEKYAEEHILKLAKKSKFVPYGPEAVIAYFFAKQNNARIIRMIMVGKLNKIPENIIRERLFELYA